jgi:hypothetical protein
MQNRILWVLGTLAALTAVWGCEAAEPNPAPEQGMPMAGQAPIPSSGGAGGVGAVGGTDVPIAGTGNTGGTAGQAPTGGVGGMTAGTEAGAAGVAGAMQAGAAGVAGVSDAGAAGMTATLPCATPEEETFSFFLISHEAIVRESGSPDGFGGNFGGITGADALCLAVALSSSECASNKTWRAFLSTTTEDAIDRIGQGPWHDRVGRVLALQLADLIADRPTSADPAIIDDLPNEFGVPNHNPDGTGQVDNHQILTGSGVDGRLYTQATSGGGGTGGGGFGSMTSCDGGWTPEKATCWDWTRDDSEGCPRVGHSWPRQGSGINWISVWNEGGCAPGGTLEEFTMPDGMTVGSYGGYGGFYCFAVTP